MNFLKGTDKLEIEISQKYKNIRIENKYSSNLDSLAEIFKNSFKKISPVEYVGYEERNAIINSKFTVVIPKKTYINNKKDIKIICEFLSKLLKEMNKSNEVYDMKFIPEIKPKSKINPSDRIEFSPNFAYENNILENERVTVFDADNKQIFNRSAHVNEKLKNMEITNLPVKESGNFGIQKRNVFSFSEVLIQKISDVDKEVAHISKKNHAILTKIGCKKIEILNIYTGASFDLEIDKVIGVEDISDNSIRLNSLHRKLLECNYPKNLSDYYYTKIVEKNNSNKIKKYYKNRQVMTDSILERHFSTNDNFEEILIEKDAIKKEFKKSGYPRIDVCPIFEEKNSKFLKKRISNCTEKILEILIGTTEKQLKCIRPYETDEASNVVRLTKSTAELLGVKETDNVILSYRGNKRKARILYIEDERAISETNIIPTASELNICIGVSASMRNQLGIANIDICCDVKRDMKYLFFKNLNIQFFSIIAIIIAIIQTLGNTSLAWGLIFSFSPIAIYLIFSEVRNQIKNK